MVSLNFFSRGVEFCKLFIKPVFETTQIQGDTLYNKAGILA